MFGLAGGTYNRTQQVGLTDSTPGAKIYYTLDGGAPDTGSTLYSGPIMLRESATLQAVAAAPGYALSAVAKAVYTIALQTPTIGLSSSAAAAYTGNPITFTAMLTATTGTPSGTVMFMDGTSKLGTGNISGGKTSFTTSALSTGTHSITAVYSGDDGFNAVTSAAVTETISDFTFALPSGGSTSASVKPGGTATYQLAVAPPSGTTTVSAVTFSVSGLPAGATSTFNPASVPANSGATNVTLSITVPSQSAAARSESSRLPAVLGLALLPLLGFRSIRRVASSRLLVLLLVISSGVGLVALNGCGGSGNGTSGTGRGSQPQTYTLTVTASAGADTHSTKLTLTVQ